MSLLNVFLIAVICRELGFDVKTGVGWLSPTTPQIALPLFAIVIAASYTGALMFMMRAFFRAINNFDLSPLSFMGAWVNLVLGVAASWFFVYGLMKVPGSFLSSLFPDETVLALVIVTSFAIGYLPDLAARNLIRASQLRNYKREDVEVYKSFTAIPVEVIDGVDTEIRDRLAEYHISAVQNLAAINPLLLYVETPYGVYQIMDWVAQAQLCCSVGPSSLVKLWRLGIRTIFDLERAALDASCRHPEVLAEIGKALFGSENKSPAINIVSQEAIIADILVRLESPHVLRLRQLFIRVGDRMSGFRRFRPVMDCPTSEVQVCPFVAAKARAA